MTSTQIIILVVVLIWIMIFFRLMFEIEGDIKSLAILPKEIRETSNLNLFGSWIMTIILFIGCPLFFIVRFLYQIIHVRKEDD